ADGACAGPPPTGGGGVVRSAAREGLSTLGASQLDPKRRHTMGKYFLGWLLGVPLFVLLIAYFFFGG
ncbi:MAG TPA: hypothetical protein VIP10_02685, partial [Burkholderiaceae bacterium]